MSITIRAVYEQGVLRPVKPLPLEEGETVDVTIAKANSSTVAAGEEGIRRRLQCAATISDWVEATQLLPADDGRYDVVKAMNENRLWSGDCAGDS
ncbi:MAG TPA: antitoxin family protein [Gemmataceae bacterium]|jgi:predicted DNA-binding antitoxin AbrB/MazE fold protein|nr:antitoxin family protein [Gemmataceae bacterium]